MWTFLAINFGLIALVFAPLALAAIFKWQWLMTVYEKFIGDLLSGWRENAWLVFSIGMIVSTNFQAVVVYYHKPLQSPLPSVAQIGDVGQKSAREGWTDGRMTERLGGVFSGDYQALEKPTKDNLVQVNQGALVFAVKGDQIVEDKALARNTVVKIIGEVLTSTESRYLKVVLPDKNGDYPEDNAAWMSVKTLYPYAARPESSSPIWGFAAILSWFIGGIWTGFILSDDFGTWILVTLTRIAGAFRKKNPGGEASQATEAAPAAATQNIRRTIFGHLLPDLSWEVLSEILANKISGAYSALGRRA